MNRMFPTKFRLASASVVSAMAILASLCPRTSAAEKRTHELFAVLTDAETNTPVPSVRIMLAPQKGNHECTIDTRLTGISNEKGEVLIPNVKPGEYIVFQSPSGSLNPELNGKVVTWMPSSGGYGFSFGAVRATKGNMVITSEGDLGIANGYMEAQVAAGDDGILGISTTAKGSLSTVRTPWTKGDHLIIVTKAAHTDLRAPSPPKEKSPVPSAPMTSSVRTSVSASASHLAGAAENPGETFKAVGLVWQKQPRDMNWNDAAAYCARLSGGHWRLPSLEELSALAKSHSIAAEPQGTSHGWYWSSSAKGDVAWYVSFIERYEGSSMSYTAYGVLSVRCVR